MMRSITHHIRFMRLLVLILLVGCSGTPSKPTAPDDGNFYTPEVCRQLGVAVKDGDTVTGVIEHENFGTVDQVQAACMSPFSIRYGCTIPVGVDNNGTGYYVIWALHGDNTALNHERCHALFEEGKHTYKQAPRTNYDSNAIS